MHSSPEYPGVYTRVTEYISWIEREANLTGGNTIGTRACAKSGTEGWCTQFSRTEEFEIEEHHLLAKIPVFPHEWKIRLQLKPKEKALQYRASWNNVFLLTTGLQTGKRFLPPSVYLGNGGIFKIVYGVNKPYAVRFYGIPYKKKTKLKNGEWIEIQMSQEMRDGKLLYRVIIDGKEVLSVENRKPKIFQNIELYTGFIASPWGEPFKGSIRELSIKIKT